jgi:hypothetical protein
MAKTPGEAYAENNYGDDVPNDAAAARRNARVVLLHALQRSGVQPPFAMTVLLTLGLEPAEILEALDVMDGSRR